MKYVSLFFAVATLLMSALHGGIIVAYPDRAQYGNYVICGLCAFAAWLNYKGYQRLNNHKGASWRDRT